MTVQWPDLCTTEGLEHLNSTQGYLIFYAKKERFACKRSETGQLSQQTYVISLFFFDRLRGDCETFRWVQRRGPAERVYGSRAVCHPRGPRVRPAGRLHEGGEKGLRQQEAGVEARLQANLSSTV